MEHPGGPLHAVGEKTLQWIQDARRGLNDADALTEQLVDYIRNGKPEDMDINVNASARRIKVDIEAVKRKWEDMRGNFHLLSFTLLDLARRRSRSPISARRTRYLRDLPRNTLAMLRRTERWVQNYLDDNGDQNEQYELRRLKTFQNVSGLIMTIKSQITEMERAGIYLVGGI
jgi:hypothetical protein